MIEIVIDGVVGEAPNTASDVRAALRMGGPVTVSVNSPGGVAAEGLAIYNVLKAHAGRVDVVVDSIAASAASLIAMAGDSIAMRDGAMIMIHDPSAVTVGTAADHQKSAAVLSKIAEQFASIYSQRSGLAVERVRQMMVDETWLDASEAVELGFATEASVEAVSAHIAAFLDQLTRYRNTPATVVAMARMEAPMPEIEKTNTNTDAPVVVADATADILARCAAANLSAARGDRRSSPRPRATRPRPAT